MKQAAASLRDDPGHQAADAIASCKDKWSRALRENGLQPLSLCPQFPAIAQRWEAWRQFEADRPLALAEVKKTEDDSFRWDKAFDLLGQPRAWLDLRRKQIEHTRFIGDTISHIRVDIGPVAMADALLDLIHKRFG